MHFQLALDTELDRLQQPPGAGALGGAVKKRRYTGFLWELIRRSNENIDTMAVVALIISFPVVVLSCAALIYDIFYLAHGLKDTSVRLLLGLITASTGGLAVSRFSKRTNFEMMGGGYEGPIYTPPGPPPGRAGPAPPEGVKSEH